MSRFETDIVHMLSAQAAEPRAEFSDTLRQKLLNCEQSLQKQSYKRSGFMQNKLVSVGLASVLIVAGLSIFIIGNMGNDPAPEQAANSNQDTSTSLESSLSTEPAGEVDDPFSKVSFKPLQPTVLIADEIPGDITVGSSNGPVDTSDTLYMEFMKGQSTFYKITQTSKQGNYPEDAEVVAITVKGQSVQANYYKVSDEADPTGRAPRSYVFMTVDGIIVQISEFGGVSKQQLIELAQSLI